MVNKITTPPTQNEVIDKINELVDGKQDTLVSGTNIKTVGGTSLLGSGNVAFPTVDQTYSATSTNAQSGVAVASAIGNGTVTINQGGELRGTFTTNQSGNTTIDLDGASGVSAVAVLNKNTASPYLTLGIWQGTESQWQNGEVKTWYNWSNSNISLVSGSFLMQAPETDIAYDNGTFVIVQNGKNHPYVDVTLYYASVSTDDGVTWNTYMASNGITYTRRGQTNQIAIGNGVYFYTGRRRNYCWIMKNNSWSQYPRNNLPIDEICCARYCNDRFILFSNYTTESLPYDICYSTDDCETWQTSNMPQLTTWNDAIYANNIYVAVGNGLIAYSTNGGSSWSSAVAPRTANWTSITYGNGKFLITSDSGKGAYSLDGINWYETTSDLNGQVVYGANIFVNVSGNTIKYSGDFITWTNVTVPSGFTGYFSRSAYGNGKFIITAIKDTVDIYYFTLTITADGCYTLEENPTTTSTVYSAPDTASSYTISSVTSGAITLSDNNTYYYNQSGNVQTYDTIGNAHPEYLCFIDGVGVKMGNTFIATNNSNNS